MIIITKIIIAYIKLYNIQVCVYILDHDEDTDETRRKLLTVNSLH